MSIRAHFGFIGFIASSLSGIIVVMKNLNAGNNRVRKIKVTGDIIEGKPMNSEAARRKSEDIHTAKKVVYYLLGLLEFILAFRFLFKILGANPKSGFTNFIYSISQLFVIPFTSIFRTASTRGVETIAVLEPGTIIAMAVYGLIAWGIARLIDIIGNHNYKRP